MRSRTVPCQAVFTALLLLLAFGHRVTIAQPVTKPGAQVLAERNFSELEGKRVGVIVNHTAMVGDRHLVNLIHESPEVTVGAIFGPEHGWRGTAEYGETVMDEHDSETGAPVYSLYGEHRSPTQEMLKDIDVLVYDIQDIGARFYTYISTMGLAMQSAATAGIPFMVLDRPNPISGEYVSGFVLEPEHSSFVGQFAIPIAHGLTSGELAKMIIGEKLLNGLEDLNLEVVTMEGYTRSMLWPETGLPWISPSPNIPNFTTALVFPGTCFFEATSASEGRGTKTPFLLIGAEWADGSQLSANLHSSLLPGARFHEAQFTPQSIPEMGTNPKLKDVALEGIRIEVTTPAEYLPVETGIHILHAFYHAAPDKEVFLSRPEWLIKLGGTKRLLQMMKQGSTPSDIIQSWHPEVETFRQLRSIYLLYE